MASAPGKALVEHLTHPKWRYLGHNENLALQHDGIQDHTVVCNKINHMDFIASAGRDFSLSGGQELLVELC